MTRRAPAPLAEGGRRAPAGDGADIAAAAPEAPSAATDGGAAARQRAAAARAIEALVGRRAVGATVCPSEVARALWGPAWRDGMARVREAADALAARGVVAITQRGLPVASAAAARGPVRLGRPR